MCWTFGLRVIKDKRLEDTDNPLLETDRSGLVLELVSACQLLFCYSTVERATIKPRHSIFMLSCLSWLWCTHFLTVPQQSVKVFANQVCCFHVRFSNPSPDTNRDAQTPYTVSLMRFYFLFQTLERETKVITQGMGMILWSCHLWKNKREKKILYPSNHEKTSRARGAARKWAAELPWSFP